MGRALVSDKLWAIIAPLLPPEQLKLKGVVLELSIGGAYRHPLCLELRHFLGDAAPGGGLRQRHDLLAAPA
jgi:transposase